MNREEDPIAAAIGAIINRGELAGVATLVWRDGTVVQAAGVGWQDMEARVPLQRDTTDDSHKYHQFGKAFSNSGRGWVMVRERH